MSILTYNGVTLPYSTVTAFEQRVVRDEEGDVDWYCTEFDITVVCYVNVAYLPMICPDLVVGGAPVTSSPSDIIKAVRTRLMAHRKTLSFRFNGVEQIPLPQPGLPGTVDAQNGPKPIYCNPVMVTNTTWNIYYRVTARYWENNLVGAASPPVLNRAGNPILYNRWGETTELNNLRMTKRERAGRYVIRSDNTLGLTADAFRSPMAVVSVPQGFLRTSARYSQDPNGLAIKYHVTDEEQFKMPPQPAFYAEGEYIETLDNWGATCHGQARCLLRADKPTPQNLLIQRAVAVCSSKLFTRGQEIARSPQGGFTFIALEEATIKVNFYQNEVECIIRAFAPVSKGRVANVSLFSSMTPFTPGSDPGRAVAGVRAFGQIPPQPDFSNPYGDFPVLMQAAAYWDPSLNQALRAGINNFPASLQVGEAGTQKEGAVA